MVRSAVHGHLERSGFFSPSQFGFRPKRSTELALAKISNHIVTRFDRGKMVLGVFLDVSAAFNCVRHDYLLAMLRHIGFDDLTVRWFESYLSHRRQVVEVNGIRSDWAELNIGTPQGLIESLPERHATLYAMRTILLCFSRSIRLGSSMSSMASL